MNSRDIRRIIEAQARLLKKIEPYESELESLKNEIEEIRDKFINPDKYQYLLNSDDYELEIEELEIYIDEKIEEVKKRIDNINDKSLVYELDEETTRHTDLIFQRVSANKRLSIWKNRFSKTNVPSDTLKKKILKIEKEISELDIEISKSTHALNILSTKINERPVEFEKENNLLNRYLLLKESIKKRKTRKYKNDIFQILKGEALELEQVFYTINNIRNEEIDKVRKIMQGISLKEYVLPLFNYEIPGEKKLEKIQSIDETNNEKAIIKAPTFAPSKPQIENNNSVNQSDSISANNIFDVQRSNDVLENFLENALKNGYLNNEMIETASDLYDRIDAYDNQKMKINDSILSLRKKFANVDKMNIVQIYELKSELKEIEEKYNSEDLSKYNTLLNEMKNLLISKLDSLEIQSFSHEEKLKKTDEFSNDYITPQVDLYGKFKTR